MPCWMKHKLKTKLPGEISITSDMQMTPPWWEKEKRNYRISCKCSGLVHWEDPEGSGGEGGGRGDRDGEYM